MNCHNCDYMAINNDKTLHCYMFRNEPIDVCRRFKPKDKPHHVINNFKQVIDKTIKTWFTDHVTKK